MDPIELARSPLEAALAPLSYILRSDHRIFWPYLLGNLLVALLWLTVSGRLDRRSVSGLFSPRVWLHPSTRLDLKLIFAKPVIHALFFAPWLFTSLALARFLVTILDRHLGIPSPLLLPTWQVTALYTVVLFLAWDASRYLIHRWAHEVPFLWELHKVHHSAEVMTPLTIYRSHPLESLLFQLRGLAVTGVVTALFFYVFRQRAVDTQLLGVNALGFVLNTLVGNLRHSHVWLPFPRWLEKIFISPAQHQLHHRADAPGGAGNYGSWLAIWDGLGGSLELSSELGRPRRFGLSRREANHSPHSLWSALARPMWAAARQLPLIRRPDDDTPTPRRTA